MLRVTSRALTSIAVNFYLTYLSNLSCESTFSSQLPFSEFQIRYLVSLSRTMKREKQFIVQSKPILSCSSAFLSTNASVLSLGGTPNRRSTRRIFIFQCHFSRGIHQLSSIQISQLFSFNKNISHTFFMSLYLFKTNR